MFIIKMVKFISMVQVKLVFVRMPNTSLVINYITIVNTVIVTFNRIKLIHFIMEDIITKEDITAKEDITIKEDIIIKGGMHLKQNN